MMPTAVLDIDLSKELTEVQLPDACTKALVLIRWRGVPVGQATLPVREGQLDVVDLLHTLASHAGWPLREHMLGDFVGANDRLTVASPLPASVAVCTRERPDDLRRCLDALVRMPDQGQEILVVDNCPRTTTTADVVRAYSSVRYIREDRPGLNHARNRAIKEASHPVIAFTDDDAVVDPDWLRRLLLNFGDPLVLCVTGLTMPLELETPAQECHEKYSPFGRGFERRVFDTTNCSPMASGHVGAGVNMAFRRDAFEWFGSFDEALDAGTVTCSGGDNEMFARILAAGYRIVYDPAALAWHRHRRTWAELHRAAFGYGVGVYAAWTAAVFRDQQLGAAYVAVRWLMHQVRQIARGLLRRPDALPLNITLREVCGCTLGPWAYLRSCLHARRMRVQG